MPESLFYLFKLFPMFLLVTIIYISARLLSIKKPSSLFHEISLFIFWEMIIGILMMTIIPEPGDEILAHLDDPTCFNFVPIKYYFYLFGHMSKRAFLRYFILNVGGNVLLFVPIGFFAKPAVGARFPFAVLITFGLSVFIESVQVILPRTTDIDDVILNTLGGAIGAVLWLIVNKIVQKKKAKKQSEAENG